MLIFEVMIIMKFGLNRDFLEELILREDLKLVKIVSNFHFLAHLHVLCQYVVALGTMTRKLVVAISLIDVCSLGY